MIPRTLSELIVALIAVVWIANFAAQFVIKGYTPDPSINGVFGAVVGGALALTKRKDSPPPAGPSDGDDPPTDAVSSPVPVRNGS